MKPQNIRRAAHAPPRLRMASRSLLCVKLAMAVTLTYAQEPANCDDYSQAERLSCLQQAASASDAHLARARQKLLSAIASWDESAKYQTAAKQQLNRSEQAFTRLRLAQCQLQKALGGGAIGNGLEMRHLLCIAALNTERAALLERMAQGLAHR